MSAAATPIAIAVSRQDAHMENDLVEDDYGSFVNRDGNYLGMLGRQR